VLAQVHAVTILKLLEDDTLHGPAANAVLVEHRAMWERYRHQKHDLFVSRNDAHDYFLADVSADTTTKLLANTAAFAPMTPSSGGGGGGPDEADDYSSPPASVSRMPPAAPVPSPAVRPPAPAPAPAVAAAPPAAAAAAAPAPAASSDPFARSLFGAAPAAPAPAAPAASADPFASID
jgi:hypothetical protein